MIDRARVRDLVAAKEKSLREQIAEFLEAMEGVWEVAHHMNKIDAWFIWEYSLAIFEESGAWGMIQAAMICPEDEVDGKIDRVRRFWVEKEIPFPFEDFMGLVGISMEMVILRSRFDSVVSMRLRQRGRIPGSLVDLDRELKRAKSLFDRFFPAMIPQPDFGRLRRLNRHRTGKALRVRFSTYLAADGPGD